MLRALELQDFAIVDALRVSFAPGLNVLTGETGAGKSILVDALTLLLGGRTEARVVRAGAKGALVQGFFGDAGETDDLEGDAAEVVAARRVQASGRSSARLGGVSPGSQQRSLAPKMSSPLRNSIPPPMRHFGRRDFRSTASKSARRNATRSRSRVNGPMKSTFWFT